MRVSYVTLLLAVGLLMILLNWGCSKNGDIVDSNQITGSGNLVSESRSVGTFTGIKVTNFARVVIKQDTTESLRIESDGNGQCVRLDEKHQTTRIHWSVRFLYSQFDPNRFVNLQNHWSRQHDSCW